MSGREAATKARASALSLQSMGTCSSFQTGKLLKHCFTRSTYFTIQGSRDLNSSFTCPTTNWESLRTRSLPEDRVAASSSPAKMASHSNSLLEALNLTRISYSILSPDGDLNCKPMPSPIFMDTPSMLSIHQSEMSGCASVWGSSAMKSANTCPLFESLSLYWMPYSLSSIPQRAILPDISGLCIVFRRGRSVNIIMGCAWK